jgi:cysteine-rich repeat protein
MSRVRRLLASCSLALGVAACAQAGDPDAASADGGTDATSPPRCGDGKVDPGEACDDGNANDDDACTITCVGWRYRVPITFTATAAGTNVPILVRLDATSFAYGNAAADGADLRVDADGDPTTGFGAPPLWLEAWSPAGTSYLWIRVPSTTAGTNTVWLYYGHSTGAVATASDFDATFPDTLRTTGNVTLGGTLRHDAVIVEAGHTVTVAQGAPLAIEAAYVRVAGTINASLAGYASGAGPGPGGNSTNAGAGGGGHGSVGGRGGLDSGDSPGAGGVAYGDLASETIQMGSGGGATDSSPVGGRGGGAVQIDARRIALAGAITADGGVGGSSGRCSGGGGGGGVLLRAASISFTGSISANGGAGGSGTSTANDGGGGGAGGRIKLLHGGDLVETGTHTRTGGAGGLYGDAGYGQPGMPGTYHAGAITTLPALPELGAEQAP